MKHDGKAAAARPRMRRLCRQGGEHGAHHPSEVAQIIVYCVLVERGPYHSHCQIDAQLSAQPERSFRLKWTSAAVERRY
eukprot:COSAG03_NODE_13_length_22557_cov_4.910054_1_plen_79_part_00